MGIEANLYEGEQVVRKFHPSWKNYWFWYLLGVIMLITILFTIFGILLIIVVELERRSTTYLVTDKRVIAERGLLSKKTNSTLYNKITDIETSQSFFQRIFNIGSIQINTAGSTEPEIIVRGVSPLQGVKKEIETAWDKAK